MPLVVFSADLLQRGQPCFVGLLLPVSEIGRLLFKSDFSYYFLYRFSIHSLRSTAILSLRHLPGLGSLYGYLPRSSRNSR